MRTLLLMLVLGVIQPSLANDLADSESNLEFKNVSQDHSKDRILEFWGYHNYQGSQNYSDTLNLRYYQPLEIDHWRGTARLDTSYVSNYGPTLSSQTTGQFSSGNTLLTVWGGLPDWKVNLGGRVIFPFGNSGQWAVGPQISTSFIPTENSKLALADFSPLLRYMYGFDVKNNSIAGSQSPPQALRILATYPTLGFNLTKNTQLRLWDENGVTYNSAGGGWFVPIDAMITHRINERLLFALGASKQVVQTYQEYNWSVYGKLAFNF